MPMGPDLAAPLRLGRPVVESSNNHSQIRSYPMSEDRPLNAQQLKQIQDNANLQLGKIVEQLQLRKWAVEQAFTSVVEPKVISVEPNDRGSPIPVYSKPTDPIALAAAIYDFVVQPATLKLTAD